MRARLALCLLIMATLNLFSGLVASAQEDPPDPGPADPTDPPAVDPSPGDRGPSGPSADPSTLLDDEEITGDDSEEPDRAEVDDDCASGGDNEPATLGDAPIRYLLERVDVVGNTSSRSRVIRAFVPLDQGDVLDVDDPSVEGIRWRLLGTGWFSDVRLRLARGSRRGWVVLVIEVEERSNTLVFRHVSLGVSEGVNGTMSDTDIRPYATLSMAETNLLGLGMTLSVNALGSRPQQGVEIGFMDPTFLGSPTALRASAFFNNGREFFGRQPSVSIFCPEDVDPCPPEVEARNAVVLYRRGGLSVGMGRNVGTSTSYFLDWQAEFINVRVRPEAASELRGDEEVPIDFSILDGRSVASVLRGGLVYDRRDDPALPRRGVRAQLAFDAGTRILGSDYDFLRLRTHLGYWHPIGETQHLNVSFFAGMVFGDAPFFYKFHVSDLTDLIPSRVMQMTLDRRAPPNLLGTSIESMRHEEVAARIDIEYGVNLLRNRRRIRGLQLYGKVGVYALADLETLTLAVPGYSGFSRVPIDLTFDLGIRIDTDVGIFQFGLSNIFGFVSL